MKNNISFIKEMLFNVKSVGAILPSSKYLAKKMISNIDFTKDNIIVEYGPGTGSFTSLIISKLSKGSKLIIIENNVSFFQILYNRYKYNDNVEIILNSVENIKSILKQLNIKEVDYIISGIPFKSLNKELRENILKETSIIMSQKTHFITFQYTLSLKEDFKEYFHVFGINRVMKNIPPAYILNLKKIKF